MDVFCPLKQAEMPLRILYSHGFRKRRRHEDTVREELRAPMLWYHFEAKSRGFIPLITFPRAVFLKNLRWVTTASVHVRFNIVISTMILYPGRDGDEGEKRKASENDPGRPSKFPLDLWPPWRASTNFKLTRIYPPSCWRTGMTTTTCSHNSSLCHGNDSLPVAL